MHCNKEIQVTTLILKYKFTSNDVGLRFKVLSSLSKYSKPYKFYFH